MNRKRPGIIVFFAAFSCLLVNILTHQNLYIGILNSLLLAFSLFFIYLSVEQLVKLPLLFILSFALVPIFSFIPGQPILYLFLASSILCWGIALKFPKYKYPLIALGLFILFWGALVSNGVFSRPLLPSNERFIWNVSETDRLIMIYQRDAMFVPYRARPLLFNKGIYIVYSLFTKVAGLLTLRNLYETILLANIYLLVFGIQIAYKNRGKLINMIALFGIGLVMAAAGVNRSPDKFNSLFMATPLLVYLIMLGFRKANKNIYVLLFIISVMLVGASNL